MTPTLVTTGPRSISRRGGAFRKEEQPWSGRSRTDLPWKERCAFSRASLRALRVAPTARYTHWSRDGAAAQVDSRPEQLELLEEFSSTTKCASGCFGEDWAEVAESSYRPEAGNLRIIGRRAALSRNCFHCPVKPHLLFSKLDALTRSAGTVHEDKPMKSVTTGPRFLWIGVIFLLSLVSGRSATTLSHAELDGIKNEDFGDIPSVLVKLKLAAEDQPLVVPYCGLTKSGEKLLCLGSTHLQYRTAGQWRRVPLRRSFGILGAQAAPFAAAAVPPHESMSFVFLFSRRFFVVLPGQRLRLIVDTWPDQDSAREGRDARKLQTQAFRCPTIGIFHR